MQHTSRSQLSPPFRSMSMIMKRNCSICAVDSFNTIDCSNSMDSRDRAMTKCNTCEEEQVRGGGGGTEEEEEEQGQAQTDSTGTANQCQYLASSLESAQKELIVTKKSWHVWHVTLSFRFHYFTVERSRHSHPQRVQKPQV